MRGVIIGKGNLAGKGVYADRDFKKGEVVIQYHLKPLTNEEYEQLPDDLKGYVHSHYGQLNLYSEPERYVNHSDDPNTLPNHTLHADVAICDIQKGEFITTNHNKDNIA